VALAVGSLGSTRTPSHWLHLLALDQGRLLAQPVEVVREVQFRITSA
jgi:hypothetical protein